VRRRVSLDRGWHMPGGGGMSDNVQAAIVPNMSVTPDGNRE
jgi:hypothetical protein